MLGAAKLSEVAAALEAASKNGDEAFVINANDDAMRMYDELVRLIRANLDVPEAGEESEEDEVLEFGPSDD